VPIERLTDWGPLTPDRGWLEDTADAVVSYIRHEMPELPDGLDVAMRESTLAYQQLFLDALRNRADPRVAEPPLMAIEFVRILAQRGVSLSVTSKIYRVGQLSFWEHWSARLRELIDDKGDLAVAAEESSWYQVAMAGAVIGRTLDRFSEERDRWVRSSEAVRAEVIAELLDDPIDVDANDASRKLGYELDRWHTGFVLALPHTASGSSTVTLEHVAGQVADHLGAGTPVLHHLTTRMLAGWVGSWDEPTRSDFARARFGTIADSPYVAIGSAGHGPAGFRRSHLQALAALRVARLMRSRPSGTVAYEDVAMICLASADFEAAREFVERELRGLAAKDDQTRRVAATLRVFLEEGTQRRRTAERLGIHANTVALRLRAAEELLERPATARIPETLLALTLLRVVHGAEQGQERG
jgi:DNA-binding PucR family transcriptional regulator